MCIVAYRTRKGRQRKHGSPCRPIQPARKLVVSQAKWSRVPIQIADKIAGRRVAGSRDTSSRCSGGSP